MSLSNMQLTTRINAFSDVIKTCECTLRENQVCDLETGLTDLLCLLKTTGDMAGRIYIIGNGGSAAAASHAVVDFVNISKLNAQTLHESSVLTCMSNDYGHERGFSQQLSNIMTSKDLLIAISSSGQSKNIRYATELAMERSGKVVTFTGFRADNPLRKLGHINFWLDSSDYGFVEIGHSFILHNLADRTASWNTSKDAHEEACLTI